MTKKWGWLAVSTATVGLMACGSPQKDGETVDTAEVRSALTKNTTTLGNDLSSSIRFLEASRLLNDGLNIVSVESVAVCGVAPDGAPTDCAEPEPTTEDFDLDVTDETDALVDELEQRILADAAIEAEESHAVTFLVRGDLVCASEVGDAPDPDCKEMVDAMQIRIVLTSPAPGNVDVDLLVGPNRVNPVSLQVHQGMLAAEVDLGGVAAAADHIGPIIGEELELPQTLKGRIRGELRADGSTATASVSVLQAITVADADFSFSLGQSLPLLSLSADSAASTLTGTVDAGRIAGAFPMTSYSWDDATGVEEEIEYDFSFELAGLSSTAVLQALADVVDVTNIGLGPDTSTVSINGDEVLAIDLNPEDGRTLDATITASDDDVTIAVSPKFDLSVAMQFAAAAFLLDDWGDDWMQDDVLDITLDGASTPTVRFGQDVEVLDGTLTVALQNAGISHSLTAGQCLLDADAELVDGDQTTTVEEATPLHDLAVGACQ